MQDLIQQALTNRPDYIQQKINLKNSEISLKDGVVEQSNFSDFVVGLVKGVVFGMVASILPCTFGLRTRGGTEGIAASTTAAVVWSFILILVFDFLIVRVTFALD